jgi:hypothetical protein
MTKYHEMGGLNNGNLFVTVMKAGKSKIKSSESVMAEGLLPHGWYLLTLTSHREEDKRSQLGVFLIKEIISFMMVHLPEPPSLNTTTLGLGFQHMNLRGTQKSPLHLELKSKWSLLLFLERLYT